MKVKGKEIGPAEIYAEPHTMTGQKTTIEQDLKYQTGAERMKSMNVGVGMVSRGTCPPVNPYGVGEMRGYGAATKGRKISGKMG